MKQNLTVSGRTPPPPRWMWLALPLLLCVACGPGKAAQGTWKLSLTPVKPDKIDVSGATLTLSKASLHLSFVEILGGAGTTQHSHDPNAKKPDDKTGALEIDVENKSIDLLGTTVTLIDKADATAGEYKQILLSVGPADSGDAKGFTLWIEGKAEKNSNTRNVLIQWDEKLSDFAKFEDDIDLASAGSVSVEIKLDLAKLFTGIDIFAAQEKDGKVTISKDANTALLTAVRTNLSGAFALVKAKP